MSNNDVLHRFLFDETDIRGEIVAMEKSFQEACSHQQFPKALTPFFGEFLAGAVLLSEVLKFEGILTLQARGDGEISIIMAEVTSDGNLRGILRLRDDIDQSSFSLSDATFSSLLGNAVLTLTIDPEKGKRYQGIVPVKGSSLAECLENYFEQSEQLPTQIQLFASETHCGGLFLQCLPAQLIQDPIIREDKWQTSQQLANTLSEEELFSLQNEEILIRLFHEMQCRAFEPKQVEFRCSCSKERSGNALQSLGYHDALALISEQDLIKIDCQFCGKIYNFTEKDLDDLFPNGKSIH